MHHSSQECPATNPSYKWRKNITLRVNWCRHQARAPHALHVPQPAPAPGSKINSCSSAPPSRAPTIFHTGLRFGLQSSAMQGLLFRGAKSGLWGTTCINPKTSMKTSIDGQARCNMETPPTQAVLKGLVYVSAVVQIVHLVVLIRDVAAKPWSSRYMARCNGALPAVESGENGSAVL